MCLSTRLVDLNSTNRKQDSTNQLQERKEERDIEKMRDKEKQRERKEQQRGSERTL